MYRILNAFNSKIVYPGVDNFETLEEAEDFIEALADSPSWIADEIPEQRVISQENYLVFEGREVPEPQTHRGSLTDQQIREQQVLKILYDVYPMAIRAESPQQAAIRAMALTRRISKYAVVPVTLFDFATDLEEPKAENLRLTSG